MGALCTWERLTHGRLQWFPIYLCRMTLLQSEWAGKKSLKAPLSNINKEIVILVRARVPLEVNFWEFIP